MEVLDMFGRFVIESKIHDAIQPTIDVASRKGVFDEFHSDIWKLRNDLLCVVRDLDLDKLLWDSEEETCLVTDDINHCPKCKEHIAEVDYLMPKILDLLQCPHCKLVYKERVKVNLNEEDVKRYEEAISVRMPMDEAHIYEEDLEKELKEKDPTNKALKYYGSTWKAIESFEKALRELRNKKKQKVI